MGAVGGAQMVVAEAIEAPSARAFVSIAAGVKVREIHSFLPSDIGER
jgi:pyrroline-5-carboxylate reductase